jgi:hypothetical protein
VGWKRWRRLVQLYPYISSRGCITFMLNLPSGGNPMSARLEDSDRWRGTSQPTLQKLGEFNALSLLAVGIPLSPSRSRDAQGNPVALNLSGRTDSSFSSVHAGQSGFQLPAVCFLPPRPATSASTYRRPTAHPLFPEPIWPRIRARTEAGFLTRQVYSDIPGAEVDKLTSSPKFPDHPDEVTYVTSASKRAEQHTRKPMVSEFSVI